LGFVPSFHIHVVNSDFESSDELDVANFDEARKQALRAALVIGVDEVCKGTSFFGAEVRVEMDGELRERFVVSIGQSPLK
jgi:hypothetical protein